MITSALCLASWSKSQQTFQLWAMVFPPHKGHFSLVNVAFSSYCFTRYACFNVKTLNGDLASNSPVSSQFKVLFSPVLLLRRTNTYKLKTNRSHSLHVLGYWFFPLKSIDHPSRNTASFIVTPNEQLQATMDITIKTRLNSYQRTTYVYEGSVHGNLRQGAGSPTSVLRVITVLLPQAFFSRFLATMCSIKLASPAHSDYLFSLTAIIHSFRQPAHTLL